MGVLKPAKNNPIENLHISICKQLIGVHKSTTNIGVLLEVGRVPLTLYARKLAIKNWERIRRNKANSLIIESYKESLKEKLPWVIHIKKLLEENGILTFFINPYEDKPCFVNKRIFQTLMHFIKMRWSATFKNNIGFEKYLSEIKNPKIRIQISKFRLPNHKLMIETGRHKKTTKGIAHLPSLSRGH